MRRIPADQTAKLRIEEFVKAVMSARQDFRTDSVNVLARSPTGRLIIVKLNADALRKVQGSGENEVCKSGPLQGHVCLDLSGGPFEPAVHIQLSP